MAATQPSPTASPLDQPDLYGPCHAAAEELTVILKEEAEILKRFASTELLELLPRKELAVRELAEKLAMLRQRSPEKDAPAWTALKERLREIERGNQANRRFVEGALAHWQDFLAIFCPPGYGPAEAQKQQQLPLKGLAFHREI